MPVTVQAYFLALIKLSGGASDFLFELKKRGLGVLYVKASRDCSPYRVLDHCGPIQNAVKTS